MSEKVTFNINQDILDAITPMAIEFNRKSIQYGDYLTNVIAIIAYPSQVNAGWLSRVANIEGVVLSMHLTYADPTKLLSRINKSITELRTRIQSGGNALMIQRWEQQQKDAETLLAKIDREQENLFYLSVVIMVYAYNEDELRTRTGKVEAVLAGAKMRGRNCLYLQEQGLKSVAPIAYLDPAILDIAGRNMPASTVAAAYPFNVSGINDGIGFIMGRDLTGGLVLIDTWKRGQSRTNSNWTVLGTSGVGKSATIKHIFLNEYALGTKIIIIDPEREYKDLCNAVGGQWINVGGGSKQTGMINPLQIKSIPSDSDDLDDPSEDGLTLARHFQSLRTFFKLYMRNLSDMELAVLDEIIEMLYAQFGITWDTDISKLKNTDYPILSDLYNLIKEQEKQEQDPNRKEAMNRLHSMLRSTAVGADAILWNGHSTLTANSDFIVLDTFDLNEADEHLRRTQYYNVLTWCWDILSLNREEKILLGVDEAYLLVDPEVPQSIQFLRNVAKRCRKYNAGLLVISQSAGDFLYPEVIRFGQALLDNACYKLIMGMDGKALEEITDLFNLTESEYDMLSKKRRGEGLFIVGSDRHYTIIDIPDYELELFGSGGGN